MVSNGCCCIRFDLLRRAEDCGQRGTGAVPLLSAFPKLLPLVHGYTRLLAYPLRNRESSMTAKPMKTKNIKIANRTARKLPCILTAVISIFLGLSELAQAQCELGCEQP